MLLENLLKNIVSFQKEHRLGHFHGEAMGQHQRSRRESSSQMAENLQSHYLHYSLYRLAHFSLPQQGFSSHSIDEHQGLSSELLESKQIIRFQPIRQGSTFQWILSGQFQTHSPVLQLHILLSCLRQLFRIH